MKKLIPILCLVLFAGSHVAENGGHVLELNGNGHVSTVDYIATGSGLDPDYHGNYYTYGTLNGHPQFIYWYLLDLVTISWPNGYSHYILSDGDFKWIGSTSVVGTFHPTGGAQGDVTVAAAP
jgi:hypothetical protein